MTTQHPVADSRLLARLSRRHLLGGGIALIGAVAAACSGSSEPSSPSPTTNNEPSPTPGGPPTPVPTPPGGYALAGWNQIETDTAPPARRDHAMAFNPEPVDGGTVLLFAGEGESGLLADTWTFDIIGRQWRQTALSGTAPSARAGHGMAFDKQARQYLLFGGRSANGPLADVWAIDASSLAARRLSDGGPPPRQFAATALDADGRRLYVAFGLGSAGVADDIWAFDLDSGRWDRVPASGDGPRPRWGARATWDADSKRLMLFGGEDAEKQLPVELWALDPETGHWEPTSPQLQPPGRTGFVMASDEATRAILAFGGMTLTGLAADVWIYLPERGEWGKGRALFKEISKREGHGAVYHQRRRSLIVFGGRGESGLLADTWELGVGPPRGTN